MNYREMRSLLRQTIALDGRFSGVDSMRDDRNRWSVSLRDTAIGGMYDIVDYPTFAGRLVVQQLSAEPRALGQPHHPRYWGSSEATLRWTEVLAIMSYVERDYPTWQLHALLQNEQGRYEMMLFDTSNTSNKRSSGLRLITKLNDLRQWPRPDWAA